VVLNTSKRGSAAQDGFKLDNRTIDVLQQHVPPELKAVEDAAVRNVVTYHNSLGLQPQGKEVAWEQRL
jgi:hypothetical protein